MKKAIVLPIDIFNALLENCAESQPEYETLRNGFIMRNKGGGQEVHIPYDAASAAELLVLAERVCPEALPYIQEATSSGAGSKAHSCLGAAAGLLDA